MVYNWYLLSDTAAEVRMCFGHRDYSFFFYNGKKELCFRSPTASDASLCNVYDLNYAFFFFLIPGEAKR